MHPELALGHISACKELSKNRTMVAIYYFSDTPKQNIHYPLYDLDLLLINSKGQVLDHHHEKEFIQEAGIDYFFNDRHGTLKARPSRIMKSIQMWFIFLRSKNNQMVWMQFSP